jgi:Family of unknown function (DUF6226)
MSDVTDLLAAVDDAFLGTSRGLRQWDDPHRGEMPADEEYSRCTDPARWRIIGARADAWIEALTGSGVATVERDVALAWPNDVPLPRRCDLLVPSADGTLALALGRTGIDDVADAGVVVGVAGADRLLAVLTFLPDCGCDACDSGSANELTVLDDAIGSVVSGTFRHLARGDASITLTGRGYRASGMPRSRGNRRRDDVERILADATGWHEVSGNAW